MTYQGVDTAARLTAGQAKILRENGISFVARYLVPETLWKALTAQEAADIRNAGLALMLCWELGGEDLRGGSVKGVEHGARAKQLAEGLGVPAGVTVYFAVDYNALPGDYPAIEQYMLAAQTAMGNKYVAGLYGHEKIVEFLAQRGTVKRFWQCVAWSNRFLPEATVRQYAWQGDERAKAVQAKIGVAVDLDATETLSGMWMPQAEYDDGGDTVIEPAGADDPGGPKTPWYAEAMAWAKDAGLIQDGRPNDPVTRAELATVLRRYDKLVDEKIRLRLPEDDSLGGLISE
ncbi:MAG: DUF1906 domain-containing protein [Oscillospiraceae bacterium]|nr:DUF1906 domain-containing protein [Oscillospiraceae bacterium]